MIPDFIVQVYAFTDGLTAASAVDAGVDHIGFVAGEYGLVPGELSFAQAHTICEAIDGLAHSVALTMAVDVVEILRMAEAVRPDYVHISTDLWDVGPAAIRRLCDEWQGAIGLMKAIPVGAGETLAQVEAFADLCDYLLLDTKVEGMPGVGATGQTHDWAVSRQIADRYPRKVLLAGGLTPANVAAAVEAVRPAGVDSNTSTNRPGDPVVKDLARIQAFVQVARRAAAGSTP